LRVPFCPYLGCKMSDLIWSVIRKHNAYKVGSGHDHATFSCEPGNLTNRHNIGSSGFTHAVAIDISPLGKTARKNAYGVSLRVRTSTKGKDVKPAKQWVTYRTRGSDFRQRKFVKNIAKSVGRNRTVRKLVQLRLAKVLRASYRKKVPRSVFRANKRHENKMKRAKATK